VTIPPEILNRVITILVTAKLRGWIEVRSLEPLLKTIVDAGHAGPVREALGEILELLERVEQELIT
jgi:hypothetical protein